MMNLLNLGVATLRWTCPSRPLRKWLVSSACAAFLPLSSQGQNITTVAGGGPNNVPALSVSISPASIAKDVFGNLYIADATFNMTRIFKVTPAGLLTVVAGNGVVGFSGDGGPATNASLNFPVCVFVDNQGNIFVVDLLNNRIREVDSSTGNIHTVAGDGVQGFSGDGGLATGASLAVPNSVFVNSIGNIFIADSGNSRIREVVAATGKIQTVAGGGTSPATCAGSTDSLGDGCLATSASLSHPNGVFVDSAGNIFIADSDNSRVREVVVATGKIQTIAGGGTSPATCAGSTDSIGDGCLATSASLVPNSVFVDSVGNVFIADLANSRIREVVVATGKIQTVAGGGTSPATCAGSTDPVGDGCLATNASLGSASGVLVDASGNVLIADASNGRVREVAAATGDITTIAGNGAQSFGGDGHPAIDAELNMPVGVFVDSSGNIFIADSNNNRVRKVVASTGDIQTVAGNGTPGFSGDGGPATSASLNLPFSVFVDGEGNLFIADLSNSRVREVLANTGNIQTVAGNGIHGFGGDGGPATNASLNFPEGVFVDTQGNVFIADTVNSRVREVVKATGNIQTVAGDAIGGFTGDGVPATNTALSSPFSVFVDKAGNLFIADSANSRIREVVASTGNIQTVAGNGTPGFSGDGGPATSAELNRIGGISVDDVGNLFIATDNRVREVEASTGNIQTIVGNGMPDFKGDGGPATNAFLRGPSSVFVDGVGNTFIGDSENNRIRAVFVPTAKLSGAALSFTAQVVGTSSAGQMLTLTNNGRAMLSISSINIIGMNSGDFSQTNNCGAVVNIGGNCDISVTFSPAAAGTRAASMIITDNAGDSPQSVNLAGMGVIAAPTMSSTALTFTAQGVGTSSAPQVVTLTNNGNAALLISSIAVTGANSGDFAQTNNCGSSVAAGGSCAINVIFKPTASGLLVAFVTITDDATNSPQNISLSGIATAPLAALSQGSLTFTTQGVGTSSAAQMVKLTNSGSASLSIMSIAVTGTNSGDFAQTNTCGSSVAAGANCTINVTFSPASAGTRTASVVITDNAGNSPQAVSLTGAGVAPSAALSSASLNFTAQGVGTSSSSQMVTLANNGNAALSITSIAVTGANAGSFSQANTCGASVAAGANCAINVTFKPTAGGTLAASITITDNATNSPQNIALSGTATDFSLNVPQASATVTAGQTASFSFQLSATGAQQTFSLTCSGAPQGASCMVPSTVNVAPGTASTVNVSVSTTGRSLLLPRTPVYGKPPANWLAPLSLVALLLLLFHTRPKRNSHMLHPMALPIGRLRLALYPKMLLPVLLLLATVAFINGCGGGGSSTTATPPGNSGTPAGTSTLTVTAASNGVSHSTSLTLTVQ